MNDHRNYLNPETISKLTSIGIQAKMIVEGFIMGMHKSPYHGFSAEFSEYRQYVHGDETRHLDWKVFGRTGKYYVKRYEQETNTRAYILLDVSSSMKYKLGKNSITKVQYAGYLAAALTLMMMNNRDAVGLVTFSRAIETVLLPSLKHSHKTRVLKAIEDELIHDKDDKKEKGTDIYQALASFARRIKPRSFSIIISDLWDDPEKTVSTIKLFRHKLNEVIVFRILDPSEKNFSFDGRCKLVDMETGKHVSLSAPEIRHVYQDTFMKHEKSYEQGLLNNAIDYVPVDTTTPFDVALLSYMKKRGRIR